jgi:hypothetical protein
VNEAGLLRYCQDLIAPADPNDGYIDCLAR